MCKLLNYPVDALSSILWKCEVNQQSAELSEISTVKKRSAAGRVLDGTRAKKFIVFWKKKFSSTNKKKRERGRDAYNEIKI